MPPARSHREVCISRALHLDVRRQADIALHQVSIDLLLTTEDRRLGVDVHGFSRSEAHSLSSHQHVSCSCSFPRRQRQQIFLLPPFAE